MNEKLRARLERTIARARLAIFWEGLWDSLYPALMVLGALLAVLLLGLLPLLPDIARLAVLAAFAIALIWAIVPVLRTQRPERSQAIRRVEIASRLDHRPVAGSEDRLAGAADSRSEVIWEEHKLRQLRGLTSLKAGQPRSTWRLRDRYAFRMLLILVIFSAVLLGRTDPATVVAESLSLSVPSPTHATTIDAWIAPPAYTARPPLMLTSPAMAERLAHGEEIIIPENSLLKVRASGASKPRIGFFQPREGAEASAELPNFAASASNSGGTFQAGAKLVRPATIRLFDDDRELAHWTVSLIPDNPPEVAFTAGPAPDPSGALGVKWKASDDYGVAGITAKFELSDVQDGEMGIAGNGVFLFDPPEFPIALKRANPKEASGTSVNDLTAHPWAGLNVNMRLEARDQTGQTRDSEVKTFRLPEREFTKPLARALIEQRKALVMTPDDTQNVVRMLDALLAWPEGLIEKSGTEIAIAAVTSRIKTAHDHEDIRSAIDFLWQIALAVEEGDLSGPRAELEAARRALERALAEGAPPQRIAELMQKLRQAMDKYLQSMAEESQRRMREGNQDPRQAQQGQMIRPEDLQKMLDTIERLAQSGAKEAAQELLSQLDNILRNLQPGMKSQMGERGESPLSQMLDQLSELMRRQQGLMDDTTRMQDGSEGENGEQQEGAQGRGPKPGDLAGQQEALGRMLEELMAQLGQQGMQAPPSFGEAGKSMEGAADALRGQQRGRALSEQGDALSRLREGAQNMTRELMQQGMGQQGNYGRHGEARGDDRDPLGRPMPHRGEDMGPDRDMLPSELAMRRAREILEMLRSRANLPDLRKLERDYLDRLLRGLY